MKEGELIKCLFKLTRTHRRRCHTEFKKFEITKGQPMILNYLAQHDGCIQKDIAKNCNIEPATATNILGTMEKVGFIERRANPNDRRVLNVYLTEKGIITQKNSQKVICEIEKECFDGFTAKEKEEAFILLERMCKNLRKGDEKKNDKTT